MSPYDNLLLCQPVSSPLPLRYVTWSLEGLGGAVVEACAGLVRVVGD